jgi:hypothetical protein
MKRSNKAGKSIVFGGDIEFRVSIGRISFVPPAKRKRRASSTCNNPKHDIHRQVSPFKVSSQLN